MATWLLSILIFGSAGYIVYGKLKGKSSCEDCHSACPVKPKKPIE
ncbi:MAG: FeoB-associated Cys-rich membrane protein [Enterococcus sp.]